MRRIPAFDDDSRHPPRLEIRGHGQLRLREPLWRARLRMAASRSGRAGARRAVSCRGMTRRFICGFSTRCARIACGNHVGAFEGHATQDLPGRPFARFDPFVAWPSTSRLRARTEPGWTWAAALTKLAEISHPEFEARFCPKARSQKAHISHRQLLRDTMAAGGFHGISTGGGISIAETGRTCGNVFAGGLVSKPPTAQLRFSTSSTIASTMGRATLPLAFSWLTMADTTSISPLWPARCQ